jgi:hypothetical protein
MGVPIPVCTIADDDGDWSGPIMLIMRGNSGKYEDESGNERQWPKGALHEGPAKEYAVLMGILMGFTGGFKPKVLDVKGNSRPPGPDAKPGPDGIIHGTRKDSEGTLMALDCVQKHPAIVALYGFSGGGYNIKPILNQMTDEQRKRIRLVTVVGVDADAPKGDYDSSKFPSGSWRVDYLANSGNHMLLPKRLLERTAKAGIDAVTGVGPIPRPAHKTHATKK